MSGETRITIRPYLDQDWDAICQVHDRAQPGEFEGTFDFPVVSPLAENTNLKRFFPQCHRFVACDQDRIVGFIAIYQNQISLLYIDPDYQGRGIGGRLLQLAINIIGSPVWTVTVAGNQKALRFYQRAGFEVMDQFGGQVQQQSCKFVRLRRVGPCQLQSSKLQSSK
ncbi:MAG: GNAT family N-acetyltransferase [Microcoleaceae cyanobacterium]